MKTLCKSTTIQSLLSLFMIILLAGFVIFPQKSISVDSSRKANNSSEIDVPKRAAITVDGKMNEDEWKDALTLDLKGGGQLKLSRNGEFLQIGIRGGKAGLSHVYLTDGKDVFVLHASAQLGMAVYRKEGEVWQPIQKFKWGLRDQAGNHPGSLAYLKTNGWLASVTVEPSNEREYKVSTKFKDGGKFRLAAAYVGNPMSPQFFPNTITDDTLKPQLLFGSEPVNLHFKLEQWAVFKF